MQLQKIEALVIGGEEVTEPVEPVGDSIVLSVDSLGLESQKYASGTKEVNGVTFEFVELGNYGNGIQMRKHSQLWNSTPFSKTIASVTLKYNEKMLGYTNPDYFEFSFGTSVKPTTSVVKWGTEEGVSDYTITPTVTDATYFFMNKVIEKYSFYFTEIIINFNEAE